jgi:hypothetical protein
MQSQYKREKKELMLKTKEKKKSMSPISIRLVLQLSTSRLLKRFES